MTLLRFYTFCKLNKKNHFYINFYKYSVDTYLRIYLIKWYPLLPLSGQAMGQGVGWRQTTTMHIQLCCNYYSSFFCSLRIVLSLFILSCVIQKSPWIFAPLDIKRMERSSSSSFFTSTLILLQSFGFLTIELGDILSHLKLLEKLFEIHS